MTLLYAVGTLYTFLFNRRWTFRYQGSVLESMPRYVATYALGYLFNLVALIVLVDWYALPHQLVQGALILMVAGLLFLLQKFWVFPGGERLVAVERSE